MCWTLPVLGLPWEAAIYILEPFQPKNTCVAFLTELSLTRQAERTRERKMHAV